LVAHPQRRCRRALGDRAENSRVHLAVAGSRYHGRMRAFSLSRVRSRAAALILGLAGMLAACTADPTGMEDMTPRDGAEPPPSDCDAATNWPPAWSATERQVLDLVNQQRSQGAACGDKGVFGPAEPLAQNALLDCVARAHSLDMHERDYFDHTNPDGEQPWDRMEAAGYRYAQAGENIAGGSSTADGVMEQWMASDDHCANIMNPDFVHIGIGFHGDSRRWTQVFGAPR
jgi:uncharacterized protein YkwD